MSGLVLRENKSGVEISRHCPFNKVSRLMTFSYYLPVLPTAGADQKWLCNTVDSVADPDPSENQFMLSDTNPY